MSVMTMEWPAVGAKFKTLPSLWIAETLPAIVTPRSITVGESLLLDSGSDTLLELSATLLLEEAATELLELTGVALLELISVTGALALSFA